MKRVLTALTLSAVLASPAWSGDSGIVLQHGKILYSNQQMKTIGAFGYLVDFVGVTYKQNVYVCEIVAELAEVSCTIMKDKGVFQKAD